MTWLTVTEYLCHKWPRIRSVCRNHCPVFPHSWLINGVVTTVTWRMSHVEQEQLTLLEHLSSPPVFSGIRVAQSLVFCVMFCRQFFVLFHLAIALSVVLRFTASDYPFGIFQLFLYGWPQIDVQITQYNDQLKKEQEAMGMSSRCGIVDLMIFAFVSLFVWP